MVSPTKCVMLLAFFLGLVLNVAGVPAHGESCSAKVQPSVLECVRVTDYALTLTTRQERN